jgi:hypothetical protein
MRADALSRNDNMQKNGGEEEGYSKKESANDVGGPVVTEVDTGKTSETDEEEIEKEV